MSLLSALFGGGTNTNQIKAMLVNGAVIIDVRSADEFNGGHIKGAKNIPLQAIQSRLEEIKKMKQPILLCCASGNRSGQATSFLKTNGVVCENAGGWSQLQRLI